METRLLLRYFLYFLTLYLLQIFLFNYLSVGTGIFASVFILFIMLFPPDFNKFILLIVAFLTGLILDFSNDTVAINTIALTLTAYARPFILNILSTREGYQPGKNISVKNLSLSWFVKYSLIFTFIFELTYYTADIFKISSIGIIFVKTLLSTILTVPFLVVLHLLIYRNK